MLPIGDVLSPALKFLAIVLFIVAIGSLLITLVKSWFFSALGKRGYRSPRSVIISLLTGLVRSLVELGLSKWATPRHSTARMGSWQEGGGPHTADASCFQQPGTEKTVIVIGESGAWIDISEKMQRQGLNIRKVEDIAPLLTQLHGTYQPSSDNFHTVIAKCVHFKNQQLAALRAERGFLTAIINWFLVLWRKWDIARLYKEEQRYAERLSENIQALQELQQSPELAGAKAELEVIAQLRKLPGECTVFNNIKLRATRFIRFNGIPLQSSQLDHLVLSPAGLFVVETKRWSRQFAESGRYHNPFDQVQRARYLCQDVLKRTFGKLPVRSLILSAGSLPEAPEDSFTKVLHLADLNSYICWFNKKELTPDQLQDLRQYLGQYVVGFTRPTHGLSDEGSSSFLKEMLQEANQPMPRTLTTPTEKPKSRAILIPTEPPPNAHTERKYMPPAMQRDLDGKEKNRIQERLAASDTAGHKDHKYMPPGNATLTRTCNGEYCITSVARTVIRVCGAPEQGLEPGAAAADARVTVHTPAAGVKKLLIYAPDAIGRVAIAKFPASFTSLENAGFLKFPVQSVFPSKTPVCYASMFTGLMPEAHGIKQYEKPVLACKTIFDVLPAYGMRTAIVAVKDSSIDLIFRGRKVDYFSEPFDHDATNRALALITAGEHDCILVYHQNYDDLLHDTDPWTASAQEAIKRHVRAFEELTGAFDKKWPGVPRAALFAPDHGAHTDPATGKGTHGANIPGDMDVAHFWKFQY